MAERHPRVWDRVGQSMLKHCDRPRFAAVSRYAKPVGGKMVDGKWENQYARGFTGRFAETLAQEMGNIKTASFVTAEDDLIRVVRFVVTDIQNNFPRHREVAFTKTVEKKGKRGKGPGEWLPPEGREVISKRITTQGEPTYLVKATDDEMRSKVNSEETKTQRDFILKLCPRDVLEDCEDRILAVLEAKDVEDPLAAGKKCIDAFGEFGVLADSLVTYIGRASRDWAGKDLRDLRELYTAIKEGTTTFDEAMKSKFSREEDPDAQQDDRRAQQMKQQAEAPVPTSTVKPELKPKPVVHDAEPVDGRWPSKAAMLAAFKEMVSKLQADNFFAILGRSGLNSLDECRLGDKPTEAAYDEMVEAAKEVQSSKPAEAPMDNKPVFGRKK